jgi:uncharacterized membrane protein YqiK
MTMNRSKASPSWFVGAVVLVAALFVTRAAFSGKVKMVLQSVTILVILNSFEGLLYVYSASIMARL